MALLEDVKSIIKSILISTQKQMLVFDLAREYMASEGRCIPFQSLGYRTLPDFLKSIPDTMQLRTGQYNGRTLYFVQPVVNEATQHIEALVQEQNTAKNRRILRRPRGVSSHGIRRSRSSPPPERMALSSSNHRHHSTRAPSHHESRNNLDGRHRVHRSERSVSVVVSDVRSRLGPIPNRDRDVSQTDRSAVDPGTKNLDRGNHTSERPVRSEFSTTSYLDKAPQLTPTKTSQNADPRSNRATERTKSKDVRSDSELGSTRYLDKAPQLTPTKTSQNADPQSNRATERTKSKDVRSDSELRTTRYLDKAPQFTPTKISQNVDPRTRLGPPPNRGHQLSQTERPHSSTQSGTALRQAKGPLAPHSQSSRTTRPVSHSPTTPPKKVDKDFKVPDQTQCTIPPSQPKVCKKISIEEYRQKMQRCQKVADTVQGQTQGDQAPASAAVFASDDVPMQVENPDTSHRPQVEDSPFGQMSGISAMPQLSSDFAKVFVRPRTDMIETHTSTSNSAPVPLNGVVPARVLKMLLILLDHYADIGIPVMELLNKYKNHHKEVLDYPGYGFSTVMDMVNSVTEHVVAVETPQAKCTLFSAQYLKNMNQSLPNINKDVVIDAQIKEEDSDEDVKYVPYHQPTGTVQLGVNLPALRWPVEAGINCNIAIQIEHVESPSKFYFTFKEKRNTWKVQMMHEEMNDLYTHSEVNLRVRNLIKGLFVVAWKFKEGRSGYHRAKILTVRDENTCQVMHLDTGEVCDEYRENLYHMLLKYAELPQQAVRAAMHKLSPVNGCWTHIDIDFFSKMVRRDERVIAQIKEVNRTYTELDIIVEVRKQGFRVKDEMINLGIAFDPSTRVDPPASPVRDRHPISSGDVPMEAVAVEQQPTSSFREERPKPFLDRNGDCLLSMLAENITAQPANIERSPPDQVGVPMEAVAVEQQQQTSSFREERPKPFLDRNGDCLLSMLAENITAQPANIERSSPDQVGVPMEAVAVEQQPTSNFEEDRPKPFLDRNGDCLLSMLAENTAAQPANIERSSPDQAPQGWRPTGTGSYTCLPLLLESAAADVPLDCKHLIEGVENSPPCYDLSSDSDSEVEVLREASKQAAINKHRIYIVNQKWGSSRMHIVNHKNKQYLLLEEVAKLLKCSSGLALMLSRTSGRINLKCETVHQNDLSNFFKELYNLHLDHYVRDHQVQLLPIASLLSILSLFPEFEASVAPHVRESIKTFHPEASCWSF